MENKYLHDNEGFSMETTWFLEKMIAVSEKDFAEGRTYSHEQVKDMLKKRRHENNLVAACV